MNINFTNIEQSKKITEILPSNSADFVIDTNINNKVYECYEVLGLNNGIIPCWSFANLFNLLPKINDKYPVLARSRVNGMYYITYRTNLLDTKHYKNPIDACVEMFEILKKRKLY